MLNVFNAFSVLLIFIYVSLATYLFGTFGTFWSAFLFCLFIFFGFTLKLKTWKDARCEISKHGIIFITSLIISFIIPSLVYIKSEGDLSLTLVIFLLVSPCSLIIGYLWFRFLFVVMRWFAKKLVG